MKILSRRLLARSFLALRAQRGHARAVQALAATLLSQKKRGDAELVIREILHQAFIQDGELAVHVTSAHTLSASVKKEVAATLKRQSGAGKVRTTHSVSPAQLGGIITDSPYSFIDASIKRQLQALSRLF